MLHLGAGWNMLPGQRVYGSTIPQLPKPRMLHQPMDPIFKRPGQLMHDFPPPLMSQILTHSANLVSCKDTCMIEPRPHVIDLSSGQQNLPQELLYKGNPHPFVLRTQEVKNQPSQSLDPLLEQRRMNENRIPMASSSNSFQKSGPSMNTRTGGENLTPASDPYSFYNRLCELFPDIHPPQLQRVYDECGRDFLRTIDNVLYARRLRKSIMAQMAKFRTQRRNQQNNNVPNPQQQSEQGTSGCSQAQESQPQKPEKQTQQSPKSSVSSKTAPNVRGKRSRILAYQPTPTTPSAQPSQKIVVSPPKVIRTAQGPGSSTQGPQRIRKPPSPPPNVFVHQINMGQPVSGAGDSPLTKKTNQGYIFSFKRPMVNPCGAPQPHPSHQLSAPPSSFGDASSFRPPLPPPPPLAFSSPRQFPLADWRPKDPLQFDPQMPLITPQPQVGQTQQQGMSGERTGLCLQPSDQGGLPVERNLDVVQQSSEVDPPEWTLLLRSIMDPLPPADSNNDLGVIDATQQMVADEAYGNVNQGKKIGGNYLYKVNGHAGFTFLSDSMMKATEGNCDEAQVAQTAETRLGTKEGDNSVNDSVSIETGINRTRESQMDSCSEDEEIKTSPPDIMNGSTTSLGANCVN